MIRSLVTAAAVFAITSASFATPIKPGPDKILICPVTGEKIPSIKDAAGSSVYKGKTYYFCCASCKPAFDKNPAKYIKAIAAH